MDITRNQRWKRSSIALLQIEPFMMHTVVELGRIDSDLFVKDIGFRKLRTTLEGSSDEWVQLTESITLAYLWVLGTYEVIRTIDQRYKELGLSAERERSLKLKQIFERLRIPLAKLEPAKRHKETDFSFAYPALNESHGIAWKVSDTTVISRGELSSAFLEFLESLRSEVCET